jgi:tetratricopeptide (TPR) repeat protein
MNIRTLVSLTSVLVLALPAAFSADSPTSLKDTPPEYQATLESAMRSFAARDFKNALALVDKADRSYQATCFSVNVRAAVAIEEKKFDEGREYCVKALQLNPKFFPALFNLAEIPFMQGKYAEARLTYEKLIDDPDNADLVKFRLILTYILEKNDERAKELIDKIPLLNDTPIYYYAHAAWEFAHENKKEAESYLNSAETVFPKSKLANFVDVFYDLGWMKRPAATE